MKYKMYSELFEQPDSIRKTFETELKNMEKIANKLSKVDRIYLVGCGSSLSTAYTAKDALEMVTNLNIDVFTGYEFIIIKNRWRKLSSYIHISVW